MPRLLVAAWALSALTQLVLHAADFSHDHRFLTLLGEAAVQGWLLAAAWLGALLLRLRLAPEETRGVLLGDPAYGVVLGGLLFALVAPFTNAYFTHVSHPALALAAVWTLWPAVLWGYGRLSERLPRRAVGSGFGWQPWLAALLVAATVFLQSYRRHLWFGSGGKDLGLFHQSVWLLSRGEAPDNTVMGMHAFADHLELIDLLAAPLQWLWPSAGSLLLFQALCLGAGAAAVFDLARRKLDSTLAAWAAVAVLLGSVDLQQAAMFDWNPTTCGAAGLPWVVWFAERRRPVGFFIAIVVVALAKENLVLYALALCLTLALAGSLRRQAFWAAAVLLLIFVVEMVVVFPAFRPDGFRHLRFEGLGTSPREMLLGVVESPYRAFALLFTPGAKIDGLLLPFSTVAFLCLASPRWLLAMAPALLERFWSTHANRWWGHHYGAGVGFLALLAAVDGLSRLRQHWPEATRGRALGIAVATMVASALLVGTLGRFGPGPLWVWRQPYYTTVEDRADAEAILALVPADARVAAQNHLLPHLSARRAIYQLVGEDASASVSRHADFVAEKADWVALDLVQSAWPREPSFPRALGLELLARGFGVVACRNAAVLLARGAAPAPCAALTN